MASSLKEAEQEAMRQLARDISREVAVRCGDHKPRGEAERIQAAQGCCELWELDAVRSRVQSEATFDSDGYELRLDKDGFVDGFAK